MAPILCVDMIVTLNSSPPGQNGRQFADDIFKRIVMNEKSCISIRISLKFVHKRPVDDKLALFQIMAWRRTGNKPLSDPMVISLLTHICVTRTQWVKQWLLAQSFDKENMRMLCHEIFTNSPFMLTALYGHIPYTWPRLIQSFYDKRFLNTFDC